MWWMIILLKIIAFAIIIALSVIDIKEKKVPLIWIVVLLIGMFVMVLTEELYDFQENKIHGADFAECFLKSVKFSFTGMLPGILLWILSFFFSNSLGRGDGLFLAASGCGIGITNASLGFVIGIFLAFFFSLFLIVLKKSGRNTILPCIPFMSAGIFIAAFLTMNNYY